jgi:uncharacterized protein (UPF0276 family)
MNDFSFLGFGCGLRHPHHDTFVHNPPATVSWLEVIAEGYLDWTDGRKLRSVGFLENIRKNYPIALHGVSLSLGSVDPLDFEHLAKIKALLHRVDAAWFSDHLCWTGVDNQNLHDLFPLPYTEEAIRLVSDKILRTQDFLGRRILIENVSSYVTFDSSSMTEWEFLQAVLQRADCGILLDINNIYVSSRNHGFDPLDYLRAIPKDRIGQIHLAGHRDRGNYVVDTHDEAVCDAVWDLYRWTTDELGTFTTMIEWDDQIPVWEVLEKEVLKARSIGETTPQNDHTARNPARL